MKACNVFLAGALMVGTMAINDPAMAYFRPFSKPGCLGQDRQAMITLTQSQDSVCYLFNPPYPNTVQSAYTDTIISGCVVYVYTDTNCTANEITLDKGAENCWDNPAGLISFMLVCGHRYPIPHTTSTTSTASPAAPASTAPACAL